LKGSYSWIRTRPGSNAAEDAVSVPLAGESEVLVELEAEIQLGPRRYSKIFEQFGPVEAE
jgi:hypothetical protein